MFIKKLSLSNFGKFHKKELNLEKGINIIYGKNEAGKSTIHSFIRGMFFGIEKPRGRVTKEDLYTKYQPMDAPGAYNGSMEIRVEDVDYLVHRSFYQKERSCQIVNLTLGKEQKVAEDRRLSFLSENFTESIFNNTISMEQLHAKTDKELVSEVRNFIANLTTTKASEVDVSQALGSLLEKKKAIDLSGIQEKIEQVKAEIDKALLKEQQEIELSNTLKSCIEKKRFVEQNYEVFKKKEKQPFLQKSAELPLITEKYKNYVELRGEIRSLEEKVSGISIMESDGKSLVHCEDLKLQLDKLDQLSKEQLVYEDKIKEEQLGFSDYNKQQKQFQRFLLIPFILGVFLCILPIGSYIFRTSIGITIIALGFLYYHLMIRRIDQERKVLEQKCSELERERFQIADQIRDILFRNNCTHISELHNKYNSRLSKDMERQLQEKMLKEYQEQLTEKQKRKEILMFELQNYLKYFMNAPEVSKECMGQLEEHIKEQKLTIEEKNTAFEEEISELHIQIERIKFMLQDIQNAEEILNNKQSEYNELKDQFKNAEQEHNAVNLAIQTIKELSSKIHDTFGSELSRKMSQIISEITGGKYKEVIVDENLTVKILHENMYVSLERLSVGTIEQVYFTLRLMLAELFFEKENMPIILDDSFVYYDDERLSAALTLLFQFVERQILIFTCHHREENALRAMGIPYTYSEI